MTLCDAAAQGAEFLTVHVSLYGLVRDVVREKDVRVALRRGETVEDLLRRLGDAYGPALRERLLDGRGEVRKNVTVFVDGERADTASSRLGTPASEAGATSRVTVVVLAAVAGG
jgi:molybdopterin converting factor small subunit